MISPGSCMAKCVQMNVVDEKHPAFVYHVLKTECNEPSTGTSQVHRLRNMTMHRGGTGTSQVHRLRNMTMHRGGTGTSQVHRLRNMTMHRGGGKPDRIMGPLQNKTVQNQIYVDMLDIVRYETHGSYTNRRYLSSVSVVWIRSPHKRCRCQTISNSCQRHVLMNMLFTK
jgi:hypothetical protein